MVNVRYLLVALGLAPVVGAMASCSEDGSATAGSGAAAAGGSASGGGGGACIAGLEAIDLTPANETFTLNGATAAPITFTATGSFADGSARALDAAALSWTATRDDDTPPGSIDAGVLAPNPTAGGVVTITASDGCAEGSTTATFRLDVTIGQPDDPSQWTEPPVTGDPSASLVYPSSETRFPRNVYRQLFQWRTAGFDEFRLVLTGPYATVTVYTHGVHALCEGKNPAAGCWEADEMAWSYLAASNAGETAAWVVDALDESAATPVIRRSTTTVIGFSKQDVEGAIFYWSTTSAGVRRGKLSQLEPEDYIVGKPVGTSYPDGDEVGCVACHTVSRDGRYMVAPVKADSGGSLWIMEVTPAAPPTPLVTQVDDTGGHGFGTISPDNAHVVVSFKQGHLWMVDRATGAHQADLPTEAWGGGTHPDWSPDNTQLVFASNEGDAPGDSSLVLVPWDGSAWGQPAELLAPFGEGSNLFPMFDPVGEWIAFANGKGGHGDVTAQLWLVSKDGGAPIELVNANRVTSNQVTDGQYQNSQPTWAPPGDLDWIAFNTKREYGVVLEEGTQQIWVAAVDRDKAAAGQDASYPAFRVPFQGLDENNHRAFWTLDINDQGGGGSGGSGGAGGAPCPSDIPAGAACDPLQDCCEAGTYCDSFDGGVTYTCAVAAPR
jgi:hypothetical protein